MEIVGQNFYLDFDQYCFLRKNLNGIISLENISDYLKLNSLNYENFYNNENSSFYKEYHKFLEKLHNGSCQITSEEINKEY